MFGLKAGNCLSALGTVGATALMKGRRCLTPFYHRTYLNMKGSGGPYGALSGRFGRLQTEYLQTGETTQLFFMNNCILLFTNIHGDCIRFYVSGKLIFCIPQFFQLLGIKITHDQIKIAAFQFPDDAFWGLQADPA